MSLFSILPRYVPNNPKYFLNYILVEVFIETKVEIVYKSHNTVHQSMLAINYQASYFHSQPNTII